MNSLSRAWSLLNKDGRGIEGAFFISLPSGHEVEVLECYCSGRPVRILLLAYDKYHKRIGLDTALRPAAGRRRWSFDKFSGTEKDLFRFRIESHGPRAWLCLEWTGVFVVVGRFFVKDIQHAFAA